MVHSILAFVYIDPIEGEGKPNPKYIKRINKGIKDAGLPHDYVENSIRKFVPELPFDVTTETADPFYSESNLAHLRRGIAALNSGKGVEREIIEASE